MWRADVTLYNIARFKPETLNLVGCNINVIRRRQIVVVARAKEAIAIWHNFENAIGCDNV